MQKNLAARNIDVIILCGGKGERLRQLVSDRPKPLVDVKGKPFLDLLIDHVVQFGFRRLILCTGYLGEQIEQYYSSRSIIISHEETPLGTGGAVRNASSLIESNPFIVMNGDSYCPINFKDLIDDYFRKNARYEIVLNQPNKRKDVGFVAINQRLEVISFVGQLHSAGIYLFDNDIFNQIPNGPCSLENDVMPKLIGTGFYGFLTNEPCYDIGTPKRYLDFLKINK